MGVSVDSHGMTVVAYLVCLNCRNLLILLDKVANL